jgi:hypothetical protein
MGRNQFGNLIIDLSKSHNFSYKSFFLQCEYFTFAMFSNGLMKPNLGKFWSFIPWSKGVKYNRIPNSQKWKLIWDFWGPFSCIPTHFLLRGGVCWGVYLPLDWSKLVSFTLSQLWLKVLIKSPKFCCNMHEFSAKGIIRFLWSHLFYWTLETHAFLTYLD